MTDAVRVERVDTLDDEVTAAVQRLLPQLSSSAVFDAGLIEQVVTNPSTALFVARDGDAVVGMATLVVVPAPTGLRGHVEDVVVDEAARGRGAGRALMVELVRQGREAGLRSLELTSRPSRTAAIALYESVGFTKRETNVLRYAFE